MIDKLRQYTVEEIVSRRLNDQLEHDKDANKPNADKKLGKLIHCNVNASTKPEPGQQECEN